MISIQSKYERLLKDGVPVEDARGILPLNIHSDISMSINLSALYHLCSHRFCVLTQWEFRQVVSQMKELVKEHLGDIFSKPMEAPCVKARKCPMREEYCGTPVWKLDEPHRIRFYKEYIPGESK